MTTRQMTESKPSRSGTQWTEADYAKAGFAKQLRVRLTFALREKLAKMAETRGKSETQVVAELVRRARK